MNRAFLLAATSQAKRVGVRLLAILMVPFGGACSYLGGQAPWPEGTRIEDPELLTLLQPDVGVREQGLYRTKSGDVYYEARLSGPLPRGYVDHYKKLLHGRAVVIRAIGSSPHAFPPRLFGWFTKAYRPGRKVPFTIHRTEFQDRDDAWLENHWNAPQPLQVQGDRLRLRLGRRLEPWREVVIVPTQNVAQVTELPLRRFPGAVLKETDVRREDRELLADGGVRREYVVSSVSRAQVFAHYKQQTEALGVVDPTVRVEDNFFHWSGEGPHGLEIISVDQADVHPGPSSAEETKEKWPHLMEGFPAEILQYRVFMRFKEAALAARYWTVEEQARRSELLARQGKLNPQ